MLKTGIIKKAITSLVVLVLVISTFGITAIFAATDSFPDVSERDRNYAAIMTLMENELVQGYPDGSFKPYESVTRAEFATMICRALGKEKDAETTKYKGRSEFSDVVANDWYTGYINVAKEMGIINGIGNGRFAPNDNVTYAQAIKMVVGALGYTDIRSGEPWYANYMAKGTELGIGIDVEDSWTPDDEYAGRGELAQMLYNGNFVDNGISISIKAGSGKDESPIFEKEEQPFVSNGYILVPISFLTEYLDCTVKSIEQTKYEIKKDEIKRIFVIGGNEIKTINPYSNVEETGGYFSATPVMKDGTVYVPLSDIVKGVFGFDCKEDLYSVEIDKSVQRVPVPTASQKREDTSAFYAYLYSDHTIYYTANGNTPTKNSTKYDSSSGIYISKTTTVKAIAINSFGQESTVTTFYYEIGSEPNGITIKPTTLEIEAGSNYTLTADVTPSNAVHTDISWRSSDTSVATVSGNGRITAKKAGTVYIYAELDYKSSIQAYCTVTVTPPEPTINLDVKTLSLNLETKPVGKLTATVENVSDKSVDWTSSNASVANVASDGTITALAEGKSTITATSREDTTKSVSCEVTVALTSPVRIELSPNTATINGGGTQQLSASVTGTSIKNTVVWHSEDENVATVSNKGLVTAKKVPINAISITAPAETADINKTLQLSVTVDSAESMRTRISATTDEDGITAYCDVTVVGSREVTWVSSNTNVATINADGLVSTKSRAGTVTITATSKSDTSKKATFTLTVVDNTPPPVITPAGEVTLKIGETVTLSADVAVNWSSSSTAIATVSSGGVITPKKSGTVTITATNKSNSNLQTTITIIVENGAVPVITPSGEITLKIGETATLSADVAVNWSSSNTSVATVSTSGVITPVKAGTTTITAANKSDNSLKTTVTVIVEDATVPVLFGGATVPVITPPEDISMTRRGRSVTLSADVAVDWSSSDTSVATISSDGVINALEIGTTTITATNKADSTKKATITVTVRR